MLVNSATRIGQAKKLQPLWKGPLIITEVVSPILLKVSSMKKEWVVHHDRLKPCSDSNLPMWARRKRHALLGTPLPPPTMNPSSDTDKTSAPLVAPDPDDSLADPPVYCVCRKPDTGEFMIGCDVCNEWFHGKCVKVSEKKAALINRYVCPICASTH